ncbi:MAG: multiheme c-type cytochrome [Planctomycetota bacterium]|nr:multiheme c-type cytochrome [Planctomycetota bacterium]
MPDHNDPQASAPENRPAPRVQRSKPITSALRPWLLVVLGLFSILGLNSFYLGSITIAESWSGELLQDSFYQWMFLGHLILGLLFIVPMVVFGIWHLRNSWWHPNRRAVRAGLALFFVSLVLLISGVLLTRVEGIIEIRSQMWRSILYASHVVTPVLAAWLFVLHRLAGPRIRWKTGIQLSLVGVVMVIGMLFWHQQSAQVGSTPASGDRYFQPSLARTDDGNFIAQERLMRDASCRECHPQTHARWGDSAHHFSSFNNPAYLASVRQTRELLLDRDGDVHASRFCAGCHDPVPFFSGAFDNPNYDDVNDPTASAGITCTVCHAIESIPGNRGNAEFVIAQPDLYPFALSESAPLSWINRQLIKANPSFHKKTYLKPIHQTAEFCGTCHKVHIPEELNKYRWLRGQNHYDAWLLSGVSGHGVASFYYPEKSQPNCNNCHMPLMEGTDFGARDLDGNGQLQLHDHLFPGANTALHSLVGTSAESLEDQIRFLQGTIRVDIFGVRRGEDVDAPLEAPIGPTIPVLQPGETVVLETVLRTLRMGHRFTEGTADSNQVWIQVEVQYDGEIIAGSGSMDPLGSVDRWSHFINAFVLDREGRRISRRNVEDIFVPLYNHQIPPGAADTLHYLLHVPEDASGELTVKVKALYRKFDQQFLEIIRNQPVNDLPITVLGEDEVTFAIGSGTGRRVSEPPPQWMRWNDYGIGLLRKGGSGAVRGELVSASHAFEQVAKLGRADGHVNKARALIRAGRLDDAASALSSAENHNPPANPWTLDWFGARVNRENGHYTAAYEALIRLVETRYPGAKSRGFDFSRDVRLLNELGTVVFAQARRENDSARREGLHNAVNWFEKSLIVDSENVMAHWNLAQIQVLLGDTENATIHRNLHRKYKKDDSARDAAISKIRASDEAADHAAAAIVIYDLQRAQISDRQGNK